MSLFRVRIIAYNKNICYIMLKAEDTLMTMSYKSYMEEVERRLNHRAMADSRPTSRIAP